MTARRGNEVATNEISRSIQQAARGPGDRSRGRAARPMCGSTRFEPS
ncbi:MAG: hypothetical protein JNJ80_06575 [Gemmatimonadetes bacterium]|nr:hypothetical protein [Gemmatimonadota bacterium]